MDTQTRNVSFTFKQFTIDDTHCGMKVGTDGVVLGAWTRCEGVRKAIDIGCGSGIISLMIVQRCGAQVSAIDIDKGAIFDAQGNVEASDRKKFINVIECDFTAYDPGVKVDLIISNPPFFSSGEQSPSGIRAMARHEGTLNYASLIEYAASNLNKSGRLAFIYPYGHDDEIIYKAEMAHLKLRRICHLRQRDNLPFVRTLYEFCMTDGPIEKSTLTIRDLSGKYTAYFHNLTKDFYL